MKNRSFILILLAVFFLSLVACENTAEEIETKSEQEQTNSDAKQNEDENLKKDIVENESDSNSIDDNPHNDQVDSDNADKVEESKESISTEILESDKSNYLQKLNEMEEEDRYLDSGTTMIELEEQEVQRYEKWDKELNKIYGILQDQLSKEEMAKLREEQRNWIKYRDETAKESSLKYEGGSMESLEYVATQASLTRDRCYLLVAKYM